MTRSILVAALTLWAGGALAMERTAEDVSLDGHDVVFLGEIHDNPAHHEHQAAWVAALGPRALVFEMLTPALALRVGADRGDAATLGATLEWETRGWPDFSMYHPIFTAAPEAQVFGGAVPRADARQAVLDGALAVMGDAGRLFGLDSPLPEDEQTTRVASQAAAHCDALPPEMLPGMVEAQRLRDAALARAVIAALAETGGPVAVITGNGHVRRDWGAPAALAKAQPNLSVLTVGQLEAPVDSAPYDVWTVAAAPERGDPCEAFR